MVAGQYISCHDCKADYLPKIFHQNFSQNGRKSNSCVQAEGSCLCKSATGDCALVPNPLIVIVADYPNMSALSHPASRIQLVVCWVCILVLYE